MSLTPGAHLGPYEILSPIGAGGMGEVFRARDTRLDRDVAIKVLPELFAVHRADAARRGEIAASLSPVFLERHIGWTAAPCQNRPMPSSCDDRPDWERLLAAERHLQYLVPGAVLVGGTAAAVHAGHRVSMDGDHVLEDLRDRFDTVLAALESAAGWQTARVQRPVLILGQLDGILTGIRQLRRTKPLETEEIAGLRVPTLGEMVRVKAWLLATRHTVRDYLDTVVLMERLGEDGVVAALRSFDAVYRQTPDISPLAEVAERLARAAPRDVAEIDLNGYRGLKPPWNDWQHVVVRGHAWAPVVARVALEEPWTIEPIEASKALWNRSALALESDEVLAQVLDRGEMHVWRELYRLARTDRHLRARIRQIVETVPLPLPGFWLAALADLGEEVDLAAPVPDYYQHTGM